jgi:hypothetical protein
LNNGLGRQKQNNSVKTNKKASIITTFGFFAYFKIRFSPVCINGNEDREIINYNPSL